ncbi:MAG: lamin tail domain-containing protein [Verrucomicrobiota bacterium]
MTPITTFGANGWLAPNGVNGSTYAYLTTNDTERGLACGNSHLYLVSRNGGDLVRILDPHTGADLGALNLGTNVVSGGTFDINMVAVGSDGSIYVANLATDPTPFRVYRWTNDLPTTMPTVAYSGVPLAGARVGDSLAVIGSGSATRLAAGFNSIPSVTGDNGYTIIAPSVGSATSVGFSSNPPAAGDFRLGITFADATHVLGTQGGTGGLLLYTGFSGSTGTLLASPALASSDERPMSFAVIGGLPLLAALSTTDNHVSVYDMTDPATPVLLGQSTTTTGTLPTDTHNSGAVAWGATAGNQATLYAMATDDGIQAFVVTLPGPEAPSITTQPQSQTVYELSPAAFSVTAQGKPIPTYQWYQGNDPLAGATNASYTIPAVPLSDNGAQFKVVVQNLISNVTQAVTSQVATLTVTADTTPPVLLSARATSANEVQASFSERVDPVTATNLANYMIQSVDGTLPILSAALDAFQSNVVLSVSAMTLGTSYMLTVNNVTDQSAARNVVAHNSQAGFALGAYNLATIGSPSSPGAQTGIPGGYEITATGHGMGGGSDQGELSYQLRTGDFDVAVRLADLAPADVWSTAGLMARETLDASSRFAATFATPAMAGCFFEWRDPAGATSLSSGHSSVNYPNTWLRLKRAGNAFSGFTGYDGQTWTAFGSVTIGMASQVCLGFAVSSHNTNQFTTARFLEVQDVTNAVPGSVSNPTEPLGPCSRRTSMVFSEIMYKPAPRTDGRNLEFIELYNSNPWWEDIGGYRLAGDIDFTFPRGTVLGGGAFVVVARVPGDVQAVYGITNIVGPYQNTLKKTGTVQLISEREAVLLEVTYDSVLPWPAGADGTGHSIVLARPSYGEADPRAWAISDVVGGSPGLGEAYRPSPLRQVVINEFLANPDPPGAGYVELYNHSNTAVDLSNCVLTDDATLNKFVVPTNTVIAGAGFVVFPESELGFALNPAGGLLLFRNPDGSRVLDAVTYEAQGRGVAAGRWPNGAADFYPLAAPTPGAANGGILIGDLVLNELMYKPVSGNDDDQYVELYNQGANAADLGGWQFTAGISFVFPTNTVLAPGGYLVVARNQTNLFSHYPNLNPANTVGDFSGKLPHKGGRVALARPEAYLTSNGLGGWATNTIYVVEDEVNYGIGGRWGQWAHGGGSSLELINPRTNHRLPSNWADSDETTKSSWTNLEVTGLLDNGSTYNGAAVNFVQVGLLDVGECLIDNVEVYRGAGTGNYVRNPDFESGLGNWAVQGDHVRSSLETVLGGYQSAQCLHLRASDGIWTMANCVQGTLTNGLGTSGPATLRLKGRWLRGSPEVLLRVRGNYLELTGSLPVPANLGTPGSPNSRAVTNAGPAIYQVSHAPALPAASQPVVVTARFHDVDAFTPTLQWRVDTTVNHAPSYASVPMVDDGTGGDAVAGDGLYSATIPGQAAGTVVAFRVSAGDAQGALTIFPGDPGDNSGLPRECVVRFGDTIPTGSFGHCHVWMTQNWISRWVSLGGLSNESQDGTFVDGWSGRIIYNWGGRPAGSPYHQYTGSPVTTVEGQHWTVPEDDLMYGTTSFNKQHVPGNNVLDDDTLQREQTSYWMARQIGLPWAYRRYYILYVNGNQHGPLMEDSQVPDGDVLKEYWPNDNNGWLYKNNGWFEGDTALSSGYMNFTMPTWCLLGRFTTTVNGVPNQLKLARYRWMYWVRQYTDSANNFTNIFNLIAAANLSTSNPAYYTNMEALVDTEEWMRMSAIEHATGDWDSFFTQNQWNMYIYKPTQGKWTALKWDWNITLGGGTATWGPDGGNLFNVGSNDSIMSAFQNYSAHRRAYLRAFQDIANRAMNNTYVNPVLDAKYSAFVAGGITARDPGVSGGLKSWITTMHRSLLQALTNQGVINLPFAVTGPTNLATGTNFVSLTGTAPVEVKTITTEGVALSVTWPNFKSWQLTLPLAGATNLVTLQGVDLNGNALSNAVITLVIVNTNAVPMAPAPVRINEWMASNKNTLINPADGNSDDWFELYNPNPFILDLSGYYVSNDPSVPTKWQVPAGTGLAPGGFLLVFADGGLTAPDNSLHASFKLSKSGASIALFDPQVNPVDAVTFGPQTTDVSEGRYPDGGPKVYAMKTPTPDAPNLFTNSPPVLAPLADQTVAAGSLLTLQVVATDPDVPPQILTFSLDPGTPAGATINPTNGVFTWTPTTNQAPSTNVLVVRVTDDGAPPLSAAQQVSITVTTPTFDFSHIGLSADGRPTFAWGTEPGFTYRVAFKNSLNDAAWQKLVDLTATGATLVFTDPGPAGFTQRFYRVERLP